MNTLIYINIDGFSYSYYQEAKKRKKTEIFEHLFQEGVLFENLHTNLISITNPMQSAILSGCYTNVTGNFYFHFDKNTKEIIRHMRLNNAQNLAYSLKEEGKKAISIHQFMLENQGLEEGNYDYAYIKTPTSSNYKMRFKILQDLLAGEKVISGDKEFVYEKLPEFIAFYIDDLDSLGHNQDDYFDYPVRDNYDKRIDDIIDCIEKIQIELEKTINIAKQKGIYDKLTFLVTTDHGMSKYSGETRLYSLINTLNEKGFKTCQAANYIDGSDLVILPVVLSAHVYFMKQFSLEEEQRLYKILLELDYINKVIKKEELMNQHEIAPYGPDMIIFSKYPNYLHHSNYAKGLTRGTHDSYDETSNHIMGFAFGNKIKSLGSINDFIYHKQLIPTMCQALGFKQPKNANGKVINKIIK